MPRAPGRRRHLRHLPPPPPLLLLLLLLGGGGARADRLGLEAQCPGPAARRLVVTEAPFHAVGDGVADDTRAVQAALDAAAGTGACVVLRDGVFVTGGLLLGARTTLYVDVTASLRASTNGSAWVPQFSRASRRQRQGAVESVAGALVAGLDTHHSRIVGRGVLDGQAPQYATQQGSTNNGTAPWAPEMLSFRQLQVPGFGPIRPRVLSISHAEGFHVEGVTLTDSHGWTTKFVDCVDLYIGHVNVYGDWRQPNNDGIDPVSCTNVTIEYVDVNVADDAISPKAHYLRPDGTYQPSRGLTVRHSRLRSRSFAVKIGTEIYGNMSNVDIHDCLIYSSHQGIGVDLREKGHVSDVRVANVNIFRAEWVGSGDYLHQNWMGNAQPLFLSNTKVWGPIRPRGTIARVTFENVTAVAVNGVHISGEAVPGREKTIHDVRFRNVRVVISQPPGNNATNGPHPAHSDRQEAALGRGAGATAPREPVDAYFFEHVSGVTFDKRSAAAFAGRAMPGNSFGACAFFGEGTDTPAPALSKCTGGGRRTRSGPGLGLGRAGPWRPR